MPQGTYFDASRRLAASFVFITPLVGIYEIGVAVDPRARNGADPIFRELLAPLSHLGLLVLNLALLGLLFLAIAQTRKQRLRRPGLYGAMLLEACVWAGLLLAVAYVLPPQRLALPGFLRDIVASVGAGIYEEALFRFLLMGGLILLLQRGLGGHPGWVVPMAVAVSAFLFSLAHHGIGGEPWDRGVFFFRALMGVLLGLICWARGLGIVVYTHALYNVALVLRHV